MQLLVSMLRQKCVYWGPLAPDQFGQPTYLPPAELRCRWVDHTEEMVTPTGRLLKFTTQVFVPVDVKVGGVLFLGKVKDLTVPAKPFDNPGALEINNIVRTPTLSAKQFLRIAYL